MKTLIISIAVIGLVGCGGQGMQAAASGGDGTGGSGGSPVGDNPDAGTVDGQDAGVDGGSARDAGTHDAGAHDMARPDDMVQPPPTKKTLAFVWQGEQQYYMCGPSAARMALSTRESNLPTQDELANYMGTTTNGTDDIGLVRGALNHYLSITSYEETDLPDDPPSAAQQAALKQQLVASIDAGYGLVANVVSGWRPSFYPQSGTIYHYIALVGYDAGGDKVLVADPAATGCGDGACGSPSSSFYNVPKSYWIATSDLGVWITPKGYTYRP